MARCTLCGGRVSMEGRCTECGWDNRKNDKKYRLNVHNEKSVKFHYGDCDDNLNRDHSKKWENDNVFEKQERKKRSSAFENNVEKNSARRKKEVKKRQQTGTVKKKKKGIGRIIRWIVILAILADVAGAVLPNLAEELGYALENFLESGDWGYIEPEIEEVRPEKQIWNASDGGYFEMELQPGFYTAGYDIPAGNYQIECLTGTAWVNWYNPGDSYSEYACLYSVDAQKNYEELMDRECSYSEVSDTIDLKRNGILFVEEVTGTLTVSGIGEGTDSLTSREQQEGMAVVQVKETVRGGVDFPIGTYDIVLKDGAGSADIELIMDDRSYYFYLDENSSRIIQVPMNESCQVVISYCQEGSQILLEPSW